MDLSIAKLFAANGFYVFPIFAINGKKTNPYGWAGNEVTDSTKADKIIAATVSQSYIDSWPELVQKYYKTDIVAFGVLGRDCVIIDLDNKNGKNGSQSYEELRKTFDIPECKLIVKSRSSGYHLYFGRSIKYDSSHVKSVASVTIKGVKYEGVDIRGDSGYVVGPERFGDWETGSYAVVKGSPEERLSILPDVLIQQLAGHSSFNDLDALASVEINNKPEKDIYQKLSSGEMPESIPEGERNNAFYIYLNALKQRNVTPEIAKDLAYQLKLRCEGSNIDESVNIDDMITRIFGVNQDNPFDIAMDLIKRGMYMLTAARAKPQYIILNQNPYIASRQPHELSTFRELMVRYTRQITGPDGKTKSVNPVDVVQRRLPPSQVVDNIAFKPIPEEVFTVNDDDSSSRYLNLYNPPLVIPGRPTKVYYDQFVALVERLFGERDSELFNIGLDFVAWPLQTPNKKCIIAPYLLSQNRGVGKSLFLNLLTRLYGVDKQGNRQARVRRIDDISGRFFNPTGVLMNIFDEVQFSSHKNVAQEMATFWRSLKNIVTADTIEIEIKNGPIYNTVNSASIILAGNTGYRFPIEDFDRRLVIIDNKSPIIERGTMDSLFNFISQSGQKEGREERIEILNSLRYWLLEYDIKNDLSSMRAPMTDIKMEMIQDSRTGYEQWFYEHFESIDNLMARSPIITEQAFNFVLHNTHFQIPDDWRMKGYEIFRYLKRSGHLRSVKTKSGVTRQITQCPNVAYDGRLYIDENRVLLYTTRQHGEFDHLSNDELKRFLDENLKSVAAWKTQQAVSKKFVSAADLTGMKVAK